MLLEHSPSEARRRDSQLHRPSEGGRRVMRGALRLGRWFGIDIGVDWSWTFVFLLMSWNLTLVFRAWHPDWDLGPCTALAIAAALLFFASVIAHELAHA